MIKIAVFTRKWPCLPLTGDPKFAKQKHAAFTGHFAILTSSRNGDWYEKLQAGSDHRRVRSVNSSN
jgi:hypothetical protein